jgi:hypothetical protein
MPIRSLNDRLAPNSRHSERNSRMRPLGDGHTHAGYGVLLHAPRFRLLEEHHDRVTDIFVDGGKAARPVPFAPAPIIVFDPLAIAA